MLAILRSTLRVGIRRYILGFIRDYLAAGSFLSLEYNVVLHVAQRQVSRKEDGGKDGTPQFSRLTRLRELRLVQTLRSVPTVLHSHFSINCAGHVYVCNRGLHRLYYTHKVQIAKLCVCTVAQCTSGSVAPQLRKTSGGNFVASPLKSQPTGKLLRKVAEFRNSLCSPSRLRLTLAGAKGDVKLRQNVHFDTTTTYELRQRA